MKDKPLLEQQVEAWHHTRRRDVAWTAKRQGVRGGIGREKGKIADQGRDVDAQLRELHHDLRHPLAVIRTLAAAAGADPEVSDKVRACLHRIDEEARHLLSVCEDALTRSASAELVGVGDVVADVCAGFRCVSSCRVDLKIEPALARVAAVALRRAVWNLLDNAARAAGPTGTVRVRVRNLDDAVEIEVADSGPGFGRAQRGSASIGLDVVRRFAADQQGTVEFGGSDLGGARVTLVLPAPVIELGREPDPGAGLDSSGPSLG